MRRLKFWLSKTCFRIVGGRHVNIFTAKKIYLLFLLAIIIFLVINIMNHSATARLYKVRVVKWSSNLPIFKQSLDKRIYMHETSGKGYLNFRQTCAVESSAKNNPSRPIHTFISELSGGRSNIYGSPWLNVASHYRNILVVLLNETEYVKGTATEKWYAEGKWRNSVHRAEHMSDYLRMVSLWRNGGLYMDLDIIIRKSIDPQKFNNFFLCEDSYCELVNNGMFHFRHGHRITDKILEYLTSDYNSTAFTAQGPDLITRLMKEQCDLKLGYPLTNQCEDISVLPYSFVYPLPFDNLDLIFKNATQPILSWLQPSYGVHLWNKYSRAFELDLDSQTLFSVLAAENCPITFQYSKDFND